MRTRTRGSGTPIQKREEGRIVFQLGTEVEGRCLFWDSISRTEKDGGQGSASLSEAADLEGDGRLRKLLQMYHGCKFYKWYWGGKWVAMIRET